MKNSIEEESMSMRDRIDRVKEVSDRVYHISEELVRRYPVYSVLGAITLGAFLSGIVRRNRH